MRTSHWLLFGSCALALVACKGSIGDPEDGPGSDNDGPSDCVGCTPSGITVVDSTRFPRMSHKQWENTVVDLFQLDAPTGLSSAFAPDPLGGKAFDNNTASLQVTQNLWGDYQVAAETVAELVTSNPTLLAKVVPADLPAEASAKQQAWIESFGKQAWRRPLTAAEVDSLGALFTQGATHYSELDAFTAGVRVTIEELLQSPNFVYRPELGTDADENSLVALNDYELASRLSYTLWNTMPDPTLMAAADAGDLVTDTGLADQIERLLTNERATETMRSFFDQLSDAEQYDTLDKALELYPDFDPSVGAEMREELARFVTYTVLDQNGGVRELLTSRTSFVTEQIAPIYGLDPNGLDYDADGYAQVELDATQRSGILTRSGFLAFKGTLSQPDTILRGVFVNRRFICQELADPPDEAAGAVLGDGSTNREKVELLTGAGTCGASCHGSFINPIGFAFENYGALGEWRDTDNGQTIDASATFPFTEGEQSFSNAVELSEILAESPQAHACFSRYWVEYVLGRDIEKVEDKALIDLVSQSSQNGAPVREVLTTLLTSDAFRYRIGGTEGGEP
jgi:hypothetical protein